MDTDLKAAVQKALLIDPEKCMAFSQNFSREQSARSFLSNLHLKKNLINTSHTVKLLIKFNDLNFINN